MSNRSLMEFNHDYTHDLDDPAFLSALTLYLKSGCRETAERLERFGVRVISMRHHSELYGVDRKTDGFPAYYVEPHP